MQVQVESWANEMKGLVGPGEGVRSGQEAGVGRCMDPEDEDRFQEQGKNTVLTSVYGFLK